jgi:hypothetical protein
VGLLPETGPVIVKAPNIQGLGQVTETTVFHDHCASPGTTTPVALKSTDPPHPLPTLLASEERVSDEKALEELCYQGNVLEKMA